MSKENKLKMALAIPILCLLLLVGYKKYILSYGHEVKLPIIGYDPRDLLSGQYLVYTIDYGVKVCSDKSGRKDAFVCLSNKTFAYNKSKNCKVFIKGECYRGRFSAGIEKYFIPEKRAKKLEDLIRDKKAHIILSVTKSGVAQIKELLIDNKPWSESF